MKVLYVITKSDTGGAQKYVKDLAENLDQARFQAKILYGGVDVRWLSNATRPWIFFANDWLAVFELVRVFRRLRPDVIHLNSSKAGVIGSLSAFLYNLTCRIAHIACPKVIFTSHGWVFNPTNYYVAPIRWFYIILHRIAALSQDIIINVSEYDRKLARRYRIAPARKLVTIYNGIDPAMQFQDRVIAHSIITSKLSDVSANQLKPSAWIGSIGRLTKEKDYETLIRAAQYVPDAYFFIIGAGHEVVRLRTLITKLQLEDRFFLVPPEGADAQYLKAFDVFVLPSIKEGLPYTLLEASAAGVPAVVTRTGGMPEVIAENACGLVVDQRRPRMLARSIRTLLQNPHMAYNTKRTNVFTLARMVRETASCYQ